MPSVDEPVLVPAPDFPPGPRSALVIATSRYDDSRLRQLRSPVKDAEDFAAVLADPAIGGFKVNQLTDETEARIRREIAAFLNGRTADETVLIYLSCHGIQDRRGRLLFAASDTETQFPHASAIRAAELLDELDECPAFRQILILDCCFSGSFSDSKGGRDGELDLERQLRGHSRGREVLTASRGFEYSFEGEPLDGAIAGSVFTTGLVQGLRTGAADTSKDGHITVEEAYEYAFGYVRQDGSPQTPQRWLFSGEGNKIVLARSTAGRAVLPAKLPEQVTAALESGSPLIRIGGVNALAEWLADPDPARVLAATRALQEIAANDIRRVAEVASSHLPVPAPAPAAPGPAPSEPARKPGGRLTARAARGPWIPQTATTILKGHSRRILSVAFSPDGALLASAGSDRIVRLWQVATGTQVRALEGHTDWVRSVAFSPNGELLASGDDHGTVRIWQAATGAQVTMMKGHTDWIRSVAFSPNGELLASAGDDHQVVLWDLESNRQVRVIAVPGHMVYCAGFSPDGGLLASGAFFTVHVWEVATGKEARTLKGHRDWIRSVAFSPDGVLLASGSEDTTVRLWEAATGAQVRVLEGHTGKVSGVAFSPDGVLLASSSEDATVRLWEAATGKQVRVLEGHRGVVHCVAFSPSDSLLASAGDDESIRLWR